VIGEGMHKLINLVWSLGFVLVMLALIVMVFWAFEIAQWLGYVAIVAAGLAAVGIGKNWWK